MNRKNTWAAYEHKQVKEADQFAEDYKAFLNNSKTEREAIDSIVNEIETHLSVCDSIEHTVDLALQQAEAMRQSILKDAFEGRL